MEGNLGVQIPCINLLILASFIDRMCVLQTSIIFGQVPVLVVWSVILRKSYTSKYSFLVIPRSPGRTCLV